MTKCKRIAVTGSTGLVGSHLVAELLREGHGNLLLPVRKTSRTGQLYAILHREGVSPAEGDLQLTECALNNPHETPAVFRGIDTLFHCAATVAIGGVEPGQLIRTNVELTAHVVDAALRCGVRRLVHVSSIAALGDPAPGTRYVDENCRLRTLAGASAYAVSKFLCENEIARGAEQGLETVVVNPAVILGAGDWQSSSSQMIPLLCSGQPFYTEGVTGYVDVRDAARAMLLLAECPDATGKNFVLAADNLSFRDLISLAATAAGRPLPKLKAGRRLLGALQTADSVVSALAGGKPRLTREIVHSLTNKCYYKGEKIKKTVTFEYTSPEDTLRRVVRQYLNEKQWRKASQSS